MKKKSLALRCFCIFWLLASPQLMGTGLTWVDTTLMSGWGYLYNTNSLPDNWEQPSLDQKTFDITFQRLCKAIQKNEKEDILAWDSIATFIENNQHFFTLPAEKNNQETPPMYLDTCLQECFAKEKINRNVWAYVFPALCRFFKQELTKDKPLIGNKTRFQFIRDAWLESFAKLASFVGIATLFEQLDNVYNVFKDILTAEDIQKLINKIDAIAPANAKSNKQAYLRKVYKIFTQKNNLQENTWQPLKSAAKADSKKQQRSSSQTNQLPRRFLSIDEEQPLNNDPHQQVELTYHELQTYRQQSGHSDQIHINTSTNDDLKPTFLPQKSLKGLSSDMSDVSSHNLSQRQLPITPSEEQRQKLFQGLTASPLFPNQHQLSTFVSTQSQKHLPWQRYIHDEKLPANRAYGWSYAAHYLRKSQESLLTTWWKAVTSPHKEVRTDAWRYGIPVCYYKQVKHKKIPTTFDTLFLYWEEATTKQQNSVHTQAWSHGFPTLIRCFSQDLQDTFTIKKKQTAFDIILQAWLEAIRSPNINVRAAAWFNVGLLFSGFPHHFQPQASKKSGGKNRTPSPANAIFEALSQAHKDTSPHVSKAAWQGSQTFLQKPQAQTPITFRTWQKNATSSHPATRFFAWQHASTIKTPKNLPDAFFEQWQKAIHDPAVIIRMAAWQYGFPQFPRNTTLKHQKNILTAWAQAFDDTFLQKILIQQLPQLLENHTPTSKNELFNTIFPIWAQALTHTSYTQVRIAAWQQSPLLNKKFSQQMASPPILKKRQQQWEAAIQDERASIRQIAWQLALPTLYQGINKKDQSKLQQDVQKTWFTLMKNNNKNIHITACYYGVPSMMHLFESQGKSTQQHTKHMTHYWQDLCTPLTDQALKVFFTYGFQGITDLANDSSTSYGLLLFTSLVLHTKHAIRKEAWKLEINHDKKIDPWRQAIHSPDEAIARDAWKHGFQALIISDEQTTFPSIAIKQLLDILSKEKPATRKYALVYGLQSVWEQLENLFVPPQGNSKVPKATDLFDNLIAALNACQEHENLGTYVWQNALATLHKSFPKEDYISFWVSSVTNAKNPPTSLQAAWQHGLALLADKTAIGDVLDRVFTLLFVQNNRQKQNLKNLHQAMWTHGMPAIAAQLNHSDKQSFLKQRLQTIHESAKNDYYTHAIQYFFQYGIPALASIPFTKDTSNLYTKLRTLWQSIMDAYSYDAHQHQNMAEVAWVYGLKSMCQSFPQHYDELLPLFQQGTQLGLQAVAEAMWQDMVPALKKAFIANNSTNTPLDTCFKQLLAIWQTAIDSEKTKNDIDRQIAWRYGLFALVTAFPNQQKTLESIWKKNTNIGGSNSLRAKIDAGNKAFGKDRAYYIRTLYTQVTQPNNASPQQAWQTACHIQTYFQNENNAKDVVGLWAYIVRSNTKAFNAYLHSLDSHKLPITIPTITAPIIANAWQYGVPVLDRCFKQNGAHFDSLLPTWQAAIRNQSNQPCRQAAWSHGLPALYAIATDPQKTKLINEFKTIVQYTRHKNIKQDAWTHGTPAIKKVENPTIAATLITLFGDSIKRKLSSEQSIQVVWEHALPTLLQTFPTYTDKNGSDMFACLLQQWQNVFTTNTYLSKQYSSIQHGLPSLYTQASTDETKKDNFFEAWQAILQHIATLAGGRSIGIHQNEKRIDTTIWLANIRIMKQQLQTHEEGTSYQKRYTYCHTALWTAYKQLKANYGSSSLKTQIKIRESLSTHFPQYQLSFSLLLYTIVAIVAIYQNRQTLKQLWKQYLHIRHASY